MFLAHKSNPHEQGQTGFPYDPGNHASKPQQDTGVKRPGGPTAVLAAPKLLAPEVNAF
jgi:hypothetical protein